MVNAKDTALMVEAKDTALKAKATTFVLKAKANEGQCQANVQKLLVECDRYQTQICILYGKDIILALRPRTRIATSHQSQGQRQ